MKFPRNARIFRGQLDAAPFASVFFLLVIFVMLGSFIYTPGVRIQLPRSGHNSGVPGPAIAVAVDASGQFYFRNEQMPESKLITELQKAVRELPVPPTLVVQADAATRMESLDRLAAIADRAGIHELVRATLPRPFAPPTETIP